MMRLLIISVAYNTPQNRVSGVVIFVVLNTIDRCVVHGRLQTLFIYFFIKGMLLQLASIRLLLLFP